VRATAVDAARAGWGCRLGDGGGSDWEQQLRLYRVQTGRRPSPPPRVIVLEDDDVLHVAGGGYGIYSAAQRGSDETVPRALQTLQVEVDQIMKVRAGGTGR
jgi:hypothetical protein